MAKIEEIVELLTNNPEMLDKIKRGDLDPKRAEELDYNSPEYKLHSFLKHGNEEIQDKNDLTQGQLFSEVLRKKR